MEHEQWLMTLADNVINALSVVGNESEQFFQFLKASEE